MELVVTRHVWGRDLAAEQMQEKLASVLDEGRRRLVAVRKSKNGRLEIEFDPSWRRGARFHRSIQGRP